MKDKNLANRDALLAAKCTKGDNRAREQLYKDYAARVYMLCMRYTGDFTLAEDLMQDCFIRIFDNIRKYDSSKASLKTWISRITVNLLIDHLRRNKKFIFVSIDEQRLDIVEPEYDSLMQIPQDVILKMIAELPDSKRTVFNLFCLENYTHKEIAELLGIKEKTSSSILYKARVILADRVNAYIKEKGL
ncbi:MAG TPA: RNA polymerase sigma factor [Bacteroidales bacterium]|nr:RNA polymerase sigma factor [Bacteroidales bacterium]